MCADGEIAQAFKHEVVAADVPVWRQTDAVVYQADRTDILVIIGIEPASEHLPPMPGLGLLEMWDFVAEQRAQVGFRTDVPIEVIEDGWERALRELPDGAQILPRCRCDPQESDSGAQIAAAVTRHHLPPI